MRRLVMIGCFLGGLFGLLSAAGCGGDAATPTGGTGPTPKQAEKEGKSGGVPGAGKGKGP